MSPFISVVIPNYNGRATIASCLEAALASRYDRFEVIVVDDGSTDDSVSIIERFPCRLVCLGRNRGPAAARNEGARQSRGDLLFFTDADCLLKRDTLAAAARSAAAAGPDFIVGGTYTRRPPQDGFYSLFQSIFINYSETKRGGRPDYVATHAMAVHAGTFRKNGGFAENFLPIIEDVDYSHRMRRAGYGLLMDPAIQVRHIFNFSLRRSLANAVRKSMYWTMYSIGNGDLLEDSGTASVELKANVAAFAVSAGLALVAVMSENPAVLTALPAVFLANLIVSRGLLSAFYRSQGTRFVIAATLYYTILYPLAVGMGSLLGAVRYFGGGRQALRETD